MREDIHYTPPWLLAVKEGEPAPDPAILPGFTLRMGTILERDALDAELEGRFRAAPVAGFVLLEAAVAGVHHLLSAEDAGEIEGLLRAAQAADGEPLGPEELAQVREVEAILTDGWPEYRALVEQNARHDRIAPTLAFQRWCTGWANVTDGQGKPVEYERTPRGEIPDEVLRRVPPIMIRAAGFRALNLQYGVGELKN